MARAGGENFPVASRLLPAAQRAHLLALYGFARLVDELGDSAAGDRLAALDWLERELTAAYAGAATHPLMVAPAVHDRGVLAAARAVRAPDRGEQARPATPRYETWEQLRAYCALSADPVGELVLGIFGERTTAHGRALRPDLHSAAARRALPGRRRGPGPRARVPAARGSRALRLRGVRARRRARLAARCARCSPSRWSARGI